MVSASLIMVASRVCTLDTRSLAAFRAALGATLCADALLRTRDLGLMFAADGMFPLAVLARYHGDASMWSAATLVDAWWWGAAVLAVEGLAGLALAAGAATRWATIAAWAALVSIIRRTAPATNAGDFWLATMLLWSMFLPLGAAWSVDAWRAAGRRRWDGRAERVFSAGSIALVLQVAAVYLAAGLAKCNESWWSGDAVAHALSVHDHGTRLGAALATVPWVAQGITWATLTIELVGPVVLLLAPQPVVRMAVVAVFIAFHVAICGTMTVGLFGYVGMAAWLALVPSAVWTWLGWPAACAPARGAREWSGWICAALATVALVAFVHDNTPWHTRRLPRPVEVAVHALCLHQTWGMFGSVPRQHQWVYTRAELADGRAVDLLRDGRPVEDVRPTDGFLSLPHHRWHKLFWELPRPTQRIFAPSVAAALARRWNATHPPAEQVVTLEIRFARIGTAAGDDTLHELLLAAWPPRDAAGAGNLDRHLRAATRNELD